VGGQGEHLAQLPPAKYADFRPSSVHGGKGRGMAARNL
jgi:hypothetical protein